MYMNQRSTHSGTVYHQNVHIQVTDPWKSNNFSTSHPYNGIAEQKITDSFIFMQLTLFVLSPTNINSISQNVSARFTVYSGVKWRKC